MELDWNFLLPPGTGDDDPPELVIVPSASFSAGRTTPPKTEQKLALFLRSLSDDNLEQKIRTTTESLKTGVGNRDTWMKKHSDLKLLKDERDRRKIARPNRVGEIGGMTGFFGPFKECVVDSAPYSVPLRHSSASKFSEKFLKETAFCKELDFINREEKISSEPIGRRREKSYIVQKSSKLAKTSPVRLYTDSFARESNRRDFSRDPSTVPKKNKEVVLLDEDDDVQVIDTLHDDSSDKRKELKMYYPCRDHPESVELTYSDIRCLEPESFLSSPIMNFYMQYIQKVYSQKSPRDEYLFFNTFFYKKLEEAISRKDDRSYFLKLRRWWKGVNIFEKAKIFLPIHGNSHWSLVIICGPEERSDSCLIILHLDSLGIHTSTAIFHIVESFLEEEWKCLNLNDASSDGFISKLVMVDFPYKIMKEKIEVPQQQNAYDCGLFVLYFIERFIREAPKYLRPENIHQFNGNWFKPEEASGLRQRIKQLLMEELESYRLENGLAESTCSMSSESSTSHDNGESEVSTDMIIM